jgi:hypothetical protein
MVDGRPSSIPVWHEVPDGQPVGVAAGSQSWLPLQFVVHVATLVVSSRQHTCVEGQSAVAVHCKPTPFMPGHVVPIAQA